jgi:hypothetical protein
MKKLITLCLILIINIAALANAAGDITIGYNSKKSELEARIKSEYKTGTTAVFSIVDDKGKVQFTKTSVLTFGENAVLLEEVAKLKEGNYTIKMIVNNKEQTAKFTIWK